MHLAQQENVGAGFCVIDKNLSRYEPLQIKGTIWDIDGTLWPLQSLTEFTRLLFEGNKVFAAEDAVFELKRIYKNLYETDGYDINLAIKEWLILWAESGKFNKKDVTAISKEMAAEAFPLCSEVYKTLQFFNDREIPVALVSASYREFVQAVAERLSITIARYNPTFPADKNGQIIGMNYKPNESALKLRQFRDIAHRKWGISLRNMLAVDDKPKGLKGQFLIAEIQKDPEKYSKNALFSISDFNCLRQELLKRKLVSR